MSEMTKNRYLITEVGEKFGIEKEFVIHCIRAHWIKPVAPERMELDEEDLARLELIRELQEDFGANEESIPIILHLVDQAYCLKRMLNLKIYLKLSTKNRST